MANSTKSPTKPKKQNWFVALALWKKILIIFAVVAIAVVVIANLATSPSAQISDDFLNNVQAGNANKAYSLMSSGAKSTITSDEFAEVVKRIGPILNAKETLISKSVSAETGTQPTAQVLYEVIGTDGVTYQLTINLVQEDGQWKVINFDSQKK